MPHTISSVTQTIKEHEFANAANYAKSMYMPGAVAIAVHKLPDKIAEFERALPKTGKGTDVVSDHGATYVVVGADEAEATHAFLAQKKHIKHTDAFQPVEKIIQQRLGETTNGLVYMTVNVRDGRTVHGHLDRYMPEKNHGLHVTHILGRTCIVAERGDAEQLKYNITYDITPPKGKKEQGHDEHSHHGAELPGSRGSDSPWAARRTRSNASDTAKGPRTPGYRPVGAGARGRHE